MFACFVYVIFAIELLRVKIKTAYHHTQEVALQFSEIQGFNPKEIQLFERVLKNDISEYHEDSISSGGYVLHSLEASLCVS